MSEDVPSHAARAKTLGERHYERAAERHERGRRVRREARSESDQFLNHDPACKMRARFDPGNAIGSPFALPKAYSGRSCA